MGEHKINTITIINGVNIEHNQLPGISPNPIKNNIIPLYDGCLKYLYGPVFTIS
jgi:hypothetical protein